ncbi:MULTISPECIES: hypothetical protein [Brevundimonas]|jgi:hypothetical protein|uniref:Uncharacterized protein n=1 Tax=Brevundimonas fontaquae TaxID=2813778 RepID=A0ABX7LVY3_9CAUL|nr:MULTISPECIES: hypothetical protein [Brevundimonas]MEE2849950.1 hypothetical protein [Pseudomonadota bacterium]KJV42641.1 hypothetical protein VH88_04060 [Brevundimonas sp. KM4]KQR55885.1 hypothetical protein ASF81_09020 [Brevundimonas sp. Leaf168]MBC1182498.1 hypothetical protein [Brevundimonas huaxiensis]MCW0046724.1 hypothetical protein [Brevundimonas sp. BT-123]
MEPLTRTEAIIDFCLAPLALDTGTEAEREVRRRLTHVLRTYQSKTATPVAVDFSSMPSQVINEAAHGYE